MDLPSISISVLTNVIPSTNVSHLSRSISLSTCIVAFCSFSSPKIASFVRVIVAFAALSYLFVMLRLSVQASLRVSPGLISVQLNLREALHDSRWSSFHVATTLSHKRSWLSDTFTCTPPKMFNLLVLSVI